MTTDPSNGSTSGGGDGGSSLERQYASLKLLSAKMASLPETAYGLTDCPGEDAEHVRLALAAATDLPQALLTDLVSQAMHATTDPSPITAKSRETMSALAPSKVVPGLLMTDLLRERQRLIQQRLDQKLEGLALKDDSTEELSVQEQIERKALRLFNQRRKLRQEILERAAQLDMADASLGNKMELSLLGRQISLHGIRPFRMAGFEDHDDQASDMSESPRRRGDSLGQSRQVSRQFGSLLQDHFKQAQLDAKARQTSALRTARTVNSFHASIEKEEQRRQERLSKERIKALRADDEEAYLKLLDQQKDSRLTFLLNQTNEFLGELSANVRLQQQDSNAAGNEDDGEEGRVDYFQAAHRVRETVTEQPSILVGGKLKEYQLKGLEWLVSLHNNRLNGILADEMGLGKTIQTISLITHLMEAKGLPGPFLVIVPLSTMTNWSVEFERWAPSVVKVEYKGVPSHRKHLQQTALKGGRFNVVLTTYEYVIKDKAALSKIKWLYMIIDEGHRMKNSHSKLSQTLSSHYSARFRLILTGTPLQNNLPELWALLNFVLPKIFNSAKTFEEWFNAPFANFATTANSSAEQPGAELNEEETLLIIRRLHKVLRPFLLRRLKRDVEADLPEKREITLKCPMSALQQHLYKVVKDETMSHLSANGEAGSFRRLNNTIMQLRKICNHPFTFEEVEDAVNPTRASNDVLYRCAGKFELLQRALPKFIATGHRTLIFFQMTQVMTIMEDMLNAMGIRYLRLDGSTKSDDRTTLLKQFNAPDSPYTVFLLSTRAGGLGLNLQTADTVVIFDSDWNPHQDLQAQDRAHRIGQTKEVRIFRLVTTDSVEEYILEKAQFKLSLDGKVIQAGKFDHKSTNEEREQMLRAILEGERQRGDDDDDDEDDGEDSTNEEEDEGKEEVEEENYVTNDDLNDMIARNDNELDVFKRMDAADKRRGSRLMAFAELPAAYKQPAKSRSASDHNNNTAFAVRAARTKAVSYDESMSDSQWLKGLDSDDPGSELEQSDVDSPTKRVRLTMKAKKRDVQTLDADTVQIVSTLLDDLASATDEEDGHAWAELFLELPDKRLYRDYYKVIKRPVSFACIRKRLVDGAYADVLSVLEDLRLMWRNARTYNADGSEVCRDAERLESMAESLFAHLL